MDRKKLDCLYKFIEFGGFLSAIDGDISVFLWIFIVFVIVLYFRNSNERSKLFKKVS